MNAKHLLEYGALRFFLFFFSLLPAPLVYAMGRLICAAAWILFPVRLNVVLQNITTIFPDLAESEKMALARRTYSSTVRAFLFSMMMARRSVREQIGAARVRGLEDLKRGLAAGRGVILTTIHLGGFQPFFAWLSMNGLPATMIYQKQVNPYSDRFFIHHREQFGTSLEHVPKDAGMAEFQRILSDNRILAILVDQFYMVGSNVSFFGKETLLAKGTAVLHQRTGAPVFYSVCYFEDGRFNVEFREIIPPRDVPQEITEESINAIMSRVISEYEPFIRQHPEEWFNLFHKIWRLSGYPGRTSRSWRDIFRTG